MNWAILLAGIVVGWIIEWVVDLLFWRRRQKQWVAVESDYRTQLAEVKTELEDEKAQAARVAAVEADLTTAQAASGALQDQLAVVEADRDRFGELLVTVDADRQTLADRVEALEAGRTTAEAERDEVFGRLAAAEAERDRLSAQLASVDSERQSLTERLGRLAGVAVAAPAAAGAALLAISRGEEVDYDQLSQRAGDDLTLLEGIGPKIQDLLYQNGIHTYSELAECDVERLRAILLAGGGAFRMADPTTWPQQARLAAAKDWTRLQALNERLKGGVKRPVAKPAPQPDDLTILEGVGPKIQELLYQNGIHTYAELSVCDVEQLKAILDGGGPAFRMADPTTWPQQARLAAAHDWTRLQTLNERLRGGVKRPAEPPREDDLTIIEGIGPKVADCLKEHGIHTFAQLARTDVDHLHAILGDAGPAFKLAAPAVDSWPKQARLAADGAWDELHALRDALKAGRADDAG